MTASSPTWPQVIENEWLNDSLSDDVARRLIALELALIDRRARRQLRREIKQGQRDFAWAGDPAWARAEAATNAWLCNARTAR